MDIEKLAKRAGFAEHTPREPSHPLSEEKVNSLAQVLYEKTAQPFRDGLPWGKASDQSYWKHLAKVAIEEITGEKPEL